MERYDFSKQASLEGLVRALLDCIPTQFEMLPASYIDEAIEHYREEQCDVSEPSNYIFSRAVELVISDANDKLGELVKLEEQCDEPSLTDEQRDVIKNIVNGDGVESLISWYANGDGGSRIYESEFASSDEGIAFLRAVMVMEDDCGEDFLNWLDKSLGIDLQALVPEEELPEEHKKPFVYNGYHFLPVAILKRAERETGNLVKHLGKPVTLANGYSYKEFYEAYGHNDCDLFRLLEDKTLCIPCSGNLVQYIEEPKEN